MTYTSNQASQGPQDPQQGYNPWNHRGCRNRFRWQPTELLAMILGFIVFWPIGLAVLGFKFWQSRSGYTGDLTTFAHEKAETVRTACRGWPAGSWGGRGFGMRSGGGFGPRSTGNVAFDDWRAGELARLEEERRKLEQAEREFADHIAELRRARDREEFERFMSARRSRPTDTNPGAPA